MIARAAAPAWRRSFALRWPQPSGLTAQADFMRLWAAQSISLFGSEITLVAMPLTAVLVVGAGPLQMGFLTAAGRAPFLLVGLLVGVWVDRLQSSFLFYQE